MPPIPIFSSGQPWRPMAGAFFLAAISRMPPTGPVCVAERVALFKAVSEGFTDFAALALVTEGPNIPSPCGACRQVLSEFTPAMPVIMANMAGEYRVKTVAQLLPAAFSGANLKGAGEK